MLTELNADTILALTAKSVRNTPKKFYIVGSLETAKKLFKNAYIIPYVKWDKEISFLLGISELTEHDVELANQEHYYSNTESVKISRVEAADKLRKIFEDSKFIREGYTVIPFTPEKKDYSGVTDWKVTKDLLEKSASSETSKAFYNLNFTRNLLENGDAMSIILRGVHYESPCRFCELLFQRVSGECQISPKASRYSYKSYEESTCQPRVTFAAHIFSDEKNSSDDIAEHLNFFAETLQSIKEPLEV